MNLSRDLESLIKKTELLQLLADLQAFHTAHL